MAINSTTKASRLLQSRRYTQNQLLDNQDAFTRVLDLNASEIYTDQVLIPSASLPFSGSSQDQSIYSVDGKPVLKYWYRLRLTPSATPDSDGGFATWFAQSTYVSTGADPQSILPTQLTNFISPKYSIDALKNDRADLAVSTPVGYGVYIFSPDSTIPADIYQFDYKTGVLQFINNTGYARSKALYISAYQYVGRTLASNDTSGYSGSFSGSFQGNGDGLTDIPASSIVGLNLTQIATNNVTASVSEGGTSFQIINTGTPLLTVDNTGKITSAGSASFRDTTITGSLLITQNFTVLGTASFTRVTGSEIVIGSPTITLNTDDPVVRFGGMVVQDSGSFGIDSTSSFLYDGEKNQWIFQHEGSSDTTGSSIAIFGPLHNGNLGDELGLTEYTVPRAYTDHGHHIGDSNIFSSGSRLTINKGHTGSIEGVEIFGDLEVTGSFRVTAGATGSFSGSFQGNGAGLTNLPASSIVGLNLTQIADNFVTASVSAAGTIPFSVISSAVTKFQVTDVGGINVYSTASLKDVDITGSLTVSEKLQVANTIEVTGSSILSGSVNITGDTNIIGTTVISGSILLPAPPAINITSSVDKGDYALSVSESAWFYNHNVGVPSANAWKSNLNGSYFNEFDSNTNVSEVLRFVAGLLSASAPAPAPNINTYDSVTLAQNTNDSGPTTISSGIISGQRLSLGYTSSAQISNNFKNTINYGIAKGWSAKGTDGNGEGQKPYDISAYHGTLNGSGYSLTFTSNALGSSTVGNGATFFGLGRLSQNADLKVRLVGTMSFSDTASVSAPDASTATFTATKTLDYSKSVTDNTIADGNNLVLSVIRTANPAVIPNTFQDAKFGATPTSVGAFLTRSFNSNENPNTTISSSGYYRFYGISAGVTSGSDANYLYRTPAQPATRLWMPVSLIQTSMSATPASITPSTFASSSLTIAPSRSYSGVPYLTTGTSTWGYLGTSSGMFDPAYRDSIVFRQAIVESLPGTVTIAGSANSDVTCNAAGIVTTGKVYDAVGNVKNSGLPRIDDEVRSNVVITHSISSGVSNIADSGFSSPTVFAATSSGYAFNGNETIVDRSSFLYHEPGTYGHPVSSGSLGIYGGGTANSVSVENFTSESFRRVISDSTTLTTQWNEITPLTLGDGGDLQVKPSTTTGFLVNPESTKGYWYPRTGYSANHYKWFMREITTNATANIGSITLDFDPNTSADFVAFDSTTTDKIALGLIFEAQVVGKGAGNVVMYDVIKGNGSYGGSLNNQAPSTQLNPFSDNIDVQANFSSISNVTGTITLGLDNNVKQTINGTNRKVWLLVRYKGVPANSLRKLTVTVAS